ncbi:hypothetical protein ACROYT_G015984 [Oculina patagonica]
MRRGNERKVKQVKRWTVKNPEMNKAQNRRERQNRKEKNAEKQARKRMKELLYELVLDLAAEQPPTTQQLPAQHHPHAQFPHPHPPPPKKSTELEKKKDEIRRNRRGDTERRDLKRKKKELQEIEIRRTLEEMRKKQREEANRQRIEKREKARPVDNLSTYYHQAMFVHGLPLSGPVIPLDLFPQVFLQTTMDQILFELFQTRQSMPIPDSLLIVTKGAQNIDFLKQAVTTMAPAGMSPTIKNLEDCHTISSRDAPSHSTDGLQGQ